MNSSNPLKTKAYEFALQIVFLCREVSQQHREYIMSKQLLKSATSIGANVEEGQQAESRKDFVSKFSIAMKESYETRYWLRLYADARYIQNSRALQLLDDLDEISALLGSSIKTAKKKLAQISSS